MSGQNTLVTLADDSEVKRPGGVEISRQFYRDKSPQGSGIYKAMDENGNIEIIGGPGSAPGSVDFGTYTPISTFSGSATASTPREAKFTKIGNMIHVAGEVQVSSGLGFGVVTISLPPQYPSTFAFAYQLSGAANDVTDPATVRADNSLDRAAITFDATSLKVNSIYTYTFMYQDNP